ncbi:hypothetical protein B0E43_08690 [Algoriphagus sp. A40]|nr:hypothetical protein B0E43_08690 [Algoriphagus sp. A40]
MHSIFSFIFSIGWSHSKKVKNTFLHQPLSSYQPKMKGCLNFSRIYFRLFFSKIQISGEGETRIWIDKFLQLGKLRNRFRVDFQS